MEFTLDEIKKTGNKAFQNENGNANIISKEDTAWFDDLVLEGALKLINKKLISINKNTLENGDVEMEYVTDLPWSEYLEL